MKLWNVQNGNLLQSKISNNSTLNGYYFPELFIELNFQLSAQLNEGELFYYISVLFLTVNISFRMTNEPLDGDVKVDLVFS